MMVPESINYIINPTAEHEGASWKKKNISLHKDTLVENDKRKLYRFNIKNVDKSMCFSIKQISLHKFLHFVLLCLLLWLYILKEHGSNTRGVALVSVHTIRERNVFIRKQMLPHISYRIIAESFGGEEIINTELFSTEENKDETCVSSEYIMKIVTEYNSMVQALKDKIFLNPMECETFLSKIENYEQLLKVHAPELLHTNEWKRIPTPKVLQYHTNYLHANSKIKRLTDSLRHYIIIFFYLEAEWEADNEEDKMNYRQNGEYYINRIRQFDPPAQMIIQNRLENLRYELTSDPVLHYETLFEKEKKTINDVFTLCQKYMEFLESSVKRYCGYKNCSYKRDLYCIEKELQIKAPDFFSLYKWKKVPKK